MHDAITCQECGKPITYTGKRFVCGCKGDVPRVLAEELPRLAMAASELLDMETWRGVKTVQADI